MTVKAAPARDIQRTTRHRAAEVCTAELNAFLAFLGTLDEQDWSKPTDCTEWSVHDVLAHVTGQFEGVASLRVFFRRHRIGHRRYPERSRLNAMTQQQVDDLNQHPPATLIHKLATVGPKAMRVSWHMPEWVRRITGARLFPEDSLPDMRLGYILDVIGARDTWMHRVDIATATGRPMTHGPHEQEIVAQVVRELHAAWTGQSVVLTLTGPAGGTWSIGTGNPVATVRVDTVAYLRMLSGRDVHPTLDIDSNQAIAGPITAARVAF